MSFSEGRDLYKDEKKKNTQREILARIIDLAVENNDFKLEHLEERLNKDAKRFLIKNYGNVLDSEILNDPYFDLLKRVEGALAKQYSDVINRYGYEINTSEANYNSFRKMYLDAKNDKPTEKDTTSKDEAKN